MVDGNPNVSEYTDACFDCGRDVPPRKIKREGSNARTLHECEADHGPRPFAIWFADWVNEEVVERSMVIDCLHDGSERMAGPLPITPELIAETRLPVCERLRLHPRS